jgi:hypothetical protein
VSLSNRIRVSALPGSVFCVVAAVLSAPACFGQQPKVMAPHKPIAPRIEKRYPIKGTDTNQSAVGGFWMTGPNMKATLTMRNGLKTDPLTVTPVLYLSNGVRYALPAVMLEPTGIAIVDINEGLAQQGVAPYATLSGYVELDYQWAWPIICAMVKSVDTVHSVIFNYGMTAPLNAPHYAGRIASPGLTHNFEGIWWKQEKDVTGFVALSNITEHPINVTMKVTDDKESDIGDHTISVSPHGTKMVSLSELPAAASTVGGVYLTYTGPEYGLVVNGALEDETVGYSARLPLNLLPQSPADGQPPVALRVGVAELGLMNGAADPMMNFPVGTIFTPYSVIRNVSNQVVTATPTIWWMAGGAARSAALPQITLSAHQTFSLNMPAMLANAGLKDYNGSLNMTLDTKAPQGGLVFAGGSVDQKNTYVFEVLPSGFGESSAKTISNWSTGNGDDTMVTVWNPADEAQDFTFTLFYVGGQYLHSIHLEPRAALVFDISELTKNPTPDAAGNVVPAGIYQGSAEISGTQSEQEHILVAIDVGIYNVQKATCNGICPTCSGFTTGSIAVDPFALAIGGQTQETLYMQMGSGGQNSVPATNWASTNTSMATVSSGVVTGVGVGSLTVSANSQFQEAVFVPFDCNSFCPTGFVQGSTPGNVTTPPAPTITSISPSLGVVGSTVQVVITGHGFGTGPTVQAATGIAVVVGSVPPPSDTAFSASFAIASSLPAGPSTITVKNGPSPPSNAVTFTAVTFQGILTPSDNFSGRSSTTFGVGEIINLTSSIAPSGVAPGDIGGLQWSISSGGGTLTGGTAGTATYTAPVTTTTPPQPVTVVLKLSVVSGTSAGTSHSYTFTVIPPSGAHLTKFSGLRHKMGFSGVGFEANIFLEPSNVSFSSLKFAEGTVAAVATGYYSTLNGLVHQPTAVPPTIGNCNTATGCQANGMDTVDTGDGVGPFAVGDFLWAIPWQYQTTSGSLVQFTVANQHFVANSTGAATVSKAGAGPFTKNVSDPTSTY